jgi:serine/threonine protein kinase/tetratricopeptide (TPR) repeat protein
VETDPADPAASSGTSSGKLHAPPSKTGTSTGTGPLAAGQNFGPRYHVIRLLGAGGMGSVYQAWDQELEVAVAVKVIRPDVMADPLVAQDLERRFKRELLLARQVTDRHVVRIHDIGEIDGIKYITMPYVHGSDLASLLKRDGRLEVARALSIARQVATGLLAAHDAGVVHRDLKPANIMVDDGDHALIMDFGIARSTSGATAMTVGTQVIGTVEYMAPEQAKGEAIDHRADLYAFGLIVRDMLLGGRHTSATSSVAELMGRIQHPPPPLRSIDPTIPEALDALVTRCLQPDPNQRYQSASDLVRDIDRIAAGDTVPIAPASWTRWLPVTLRERLLVGVGVFAAIVALGLGGWLLTGRGDREPALSQEVSGPAITLAILPFQNVSEDSTLDSLGASVSQVLSPLLGQSQRVRTVPQDRLHQVLSDLKIAPNSAIRPAQLASIADFTSARHLLWGSITKFGDAITINATLQDLERGENVPVTAVAQGENDLLEAISSLAEDVRGKLAGGSSATLEELKSTAWKPSTNSIDALRFYNEGLQLRQQGNPTAALKRFEAATKEDKGFALAFAGLAEAYSSLGYDNEAAQASRDALSLGANLPPQEKHRIAANHFRIRNETDKAIESYENLLSASPSDLMVRFELGGLYQEIGALDKAGEHFAKVVEMDPKFVLGLLAVGRVEILRGNPQASLEYLDRAASLATQLENDSARANILQASGIAYMRLNRPHEALRRYEESLAIKVRIGDKRGMAASYVQMGEVQKTLGDPVQAEKSYREALRLRREIGDKNGLSVTLIDLSTLLDETFGRSKEALPLLREALTITRETGNRNLEARALNNLGAAYQSQGQYSDAETYFEGALAIREKARNPHETADSLHNLGDLFTKMGRYDEALKRYLAALDIRRSAGDKRNAALASFGIGTIFDYQGRYGAAVKSKAEALQALRDLKHRDIWLAEILSGYANSLSLSGRTAEAQAPLEEAAKLAEELKHPNLVAHTLRLKSDRLFLSGDFKGASERARQAEQAASRGSDRTIALLARADQSIIASSIEPARAVATRLGQLAQEADASGLKSLSIECRVARADALHALADHDEALREADRAIARADALGLKVPLAKAHYVKASALRAKGDTVAARREYVATVRLLEEVRNDDGNENVLKRADLAGMHAEAVKHSGVR